MNKIIIGTVVAVVLVVTFAALYMAPQPQQATPSPVAGALTGPDISSRYLSISGVRREYARTALQPATTTVCALQNGPATSTLIGFDLAVDVGTSTAATIDISTSTTAYASSTPALVFAASIASGAQRSLALGTGFATSSVNTAKILLPIDPLTGESAYILPPNIYVTVKTAGPGLAGYTWGGHCQMTTEVI